MTTSGSTQSINGTIDVKLLFILNIRMCFFFPPTSQYSLPLQWREVYVMAAEVGAGVRGTRVAENLGKQTDNGEQ